MIYFWIALGVLSVLGAAFFAACFVCYRMAFYVTKKQRQTPLPLPDGEQYAPYNERIRNWAAETEKLPYTEYSIVSFDKTVLFGRFYEYKKGAPMELMFHGYRGSAKRDLAGGVERCFRLGRSAFIVDQRGSGKSGGKVISFGVNEHKDCLCWVKFLTETFGKEQKIILTGISMGASTVLMAAGKPLPENVIGVLADCGYNSQKEIIKKVIGEMGLPKGAGYLLVKVGARLFGGFDLEETSAEEAMKSCTLPVIFFHGKEDDFVPSFMSERNFEACRGRKQIVIIEKAGHGLAYPASPEAYLKAAGEFFQ